MSALTPEDRLVMLESLIEKSLEYKMPAERYVFLAHLLTMANAYSTDAWSYESRARFMDKANAAGWRHLSEYHNRGRDLMLYDFAEDNSLILIGGQEATTK